MTDGIVQSPNQSCISPGVAEQYTLRNGMGLAHQEQVLRLEVCGRRGAGRGRVWKRAGKEAAEGNPTRTFVYLRVPPSLGGARWGDDGSNRQSDPLRLASMGDPAAVQVLHPGQQVAHQASCRRQAKRGRHTRDERPSAISHGGASDSA